MKDSIQIFLIVIDEYPFHFSLYFHETMENKKHLVLGVTFIVIGAIWALDNIEVIPWQIKDYLFNWENLCIAIGGYLLLTKENIRLGAILLALGVFFAIDDWFDIDVSIWSLWPLGLVFIGIYLIGRNKSSIEVLDQPNEGNTIEDTAIFSGGDKVITSQDFKGGTLTAMFGGSNIDLTTSNISSTPAVVDVFFMFGGSKIRVPHNWQVEFKVLNLFGGLSDKRQFTQNPDGQKKLIIKGLIIFGGSEVTN